MNHGFVFTKGTISEKRLDAVLREIVNERWGDLVRVERNGPHWEIAWGNDYSFGLSLWLDTARKIEMRKQLGDMSSWLQAFIQESLAARLGGKCGDEGTGSRRWVGKPEDWRTYRQWWDENHSRFPRTPFENAFLERLYRNAISKFPKELLCTKD